MADNDMGKRENCSLFVIINDFLFNKYRRFNFKKNACYFNKFHRRYIIKDTINSFKLFAKAVVDRLFGEGK